MSVAIELSASDEVVAVLPELAPALRRLQERMNTLTPDEALAVVEGVNRALATDREPVPPAIALLTGGTEIPATERVAAEVDALTRSFARRRALLAETFTTSEVARLLGSSRQTPHDRLDAGTLLAVMDQGALRFPLWQFDAEGEYGVVAGLPDVIRALDVSPMAKISWLTRPNPYLDGDTPLARLKNGERGRVVALARAVGVD